MSVSARKARNLEANKVQGSSTNYDCTYIWEGAYGQHLLWLIHLTLDKCYFYFYFFSPNFGMLPHIIHEELVEAQKVPAI